MILLSHYFSTFKAPILCVIIAAEAMGTAHKLLLTLVGLKEFFLA
jgi:hypothetical protein